MKTHSICKIEDFVETHHICLGIEHRRKRKSMTMLRACHIGSIYCCIAVRAHRVLQQPWLLRVDGAVMVIICLHVFFLKSKRGYTSLKANAKGRTRHLARFLAIKKRRKTRKKQQKLLIAEKNCEKETEKEKRRRHDKVITRAPHGCRHSPAPMLRVGQGSTSTCSIQYLVK